MKARFLTILFGALAVFMVITVVWWTIIPLHQARIASRAFQRMRMQLSDVAIPSRAFSMNTFVQPEIRNGYLDALFYLYKNGAKDLAVRLLLDATRYMQETVDRGSIYPRYLLSLAKAYNLGAETTHDILLYQKANTYYAQALAVIPNSPSITYAYGISLIDQGKKDEGIAVLRDLLAANNTIPDSHYYLALAYIKSDPMYYNRALDELEQTLVLKPDFDREGVKALYAKLFQYYYAAKDKDRFMQTARRLTVLDQGQASMYLKIMQYVARHNALPVITISQ